MKPARCRICIAAFLLTVATAYSRQTPVPLAEKIKRYAPSSLSCDPTRLSPGDRKALGKLIEAAGLMDSIYLRQAWSGNIRLLRELEADTSAAGVEKLRYFRLNMSPWSNLDGDAPFIDGVPARRPAGANYYPEDMTKEEFKSWAATLSPAERNRATGFYDIVIRKSDGKLATRSYAKEYAPYLKRAAGLLRDAARLTDNASLKKFLNARADAFGTNNYYASDVAWMDLDSPIEPTIGPYEVYLDNLFNYKAAFEAFITLRNEEETKKLSVFSAHLQEIENALPIDRSYRNPKLGALSPIRVVDEVAVGGESKAGVQTAAYNLPNDERVTAAKGSKRVLLKNVQEAKFRTILVPIASVAVDPSQQKLVSFEPFFTHILAHELMHGLGPHTITVNGKKTTVRESMNELGSALEEAKADISGLFALQFLIDHSIVPKSMERPMYATYLAGMFRSVRFGTNEAHGKGCALQFNYLADQGGFVYNTTARTYAVDFSKIRAAVEKLTSEIMTIQAEGSYEKAKQLLTSYGIIRPEMQSVLDKLSAIPVDIAPEFPRIN